MPKMTCLDANHWNLYDRNCTDCQNELENSGLLTSEEYTDWETGKFSIGFKIKMEACNC